LSESGEFFGYSIIAQAHSFGYRFIGLKPVTHWRAASPIKKLSHLGDSLFAESNSIARSDSKFRFSGFAWSAAVLLGVLTGASAVTRGAGQTPQNTSPDSEYHSLVVPATKQYCTKCHGANGSAGIDLTQYPDTDSVRRNPNVWRKVIRQLRTNAMPPPTSAQPPPEQRERLAVWITKTLDSYGAGAVHAYPGSVTIHRLSRSEYNNTVRDLLGVDTHPADSFPADGGGGSGFDNNADTLFIPPILMERYIAAAANCVGNAKAARIFIIRPGKGTNKEAAARAIVSHFGALGYRRPIEPSEIDRLVSIYHVGEKRGMTFEDSIRYAIGAILVSPKFLFRIEIDGPSSLPHAISDYELASRLSYFLWSSMPDQELFNLAAKKQLHSPAVLDRQVARMMADPKAHALADNFAGQWLKVRDLFTTAQPDPNRFQAYTPALREAMYNETIDFVQSVLSDNASLLNLIDSNYTYLNQDLAAYYGVPNVTGNQMRRVSLPDHRRGGVLTMASVLTITSYAERTSPVLRGKWVLEQVLGAPPPPPPPNAGGLSADDSVRDGLTFRQRLEKHREKPQCASCHNSMDPIGFGLENFDAIGRWRSEISGKPVDAGGILSDGSKFAGPIELKDHILAGKQEFVRNLTEKMLGYALGRGIEEYDRPTIRQISAAVEKDGYRSGTLIREIVKSYPFGYRAGKRVDGRGNK
jgi:hypothetical protein